MEARAEILEGLDKEGVDERFLAKHLQKQIAKCNVRAMSLAGHWRGYHRAWTTRAEEPREVFNDEEKKLEVDRLICNRPEDSSGPGDPGVANQRAGRNQ